MLKRTHGVLTRYSKAGAPLHGDDVHVRRRSDGGHLQRTRLRGTLEYSMRPTSGNGGANEHAHRNKHTKANKQPNGARIERTRTHSMDAAERARARSDTHKHAHYHTHTYRSNNMIDCDGAHYEHAIYMYIYTHSLHRRGGRQRTTGVMHFIIKGHVKLGVGVIATAVDAFSASKGGWLYKTIQNTRYSRVDHVNS